MNLAEVILAVASIGSLVGGGVMWIASRRERKIREEQSKASAYDTQSQSWERLLNAKDEEIERLESRVTKLQAQVGQLEKEVKYLGRALRSNGIQYREDED